jgi:uncharacterized protein YaiI (UPF0178 family)
VTVWADGDSLQPEIRSLLCRRARSEAAGGSPRFRLVFVAARPPRMETGVAVELRVVEGEPGAADEELVANSQAGDLAVTRDIALAERLVEKGLVVLNDRGAAFDANSVHERRSLRDRAEELRALGLAPESPRRRSWGKRELKAFADAFDRVLSRSIRRAGS